MFIKLDLIKLDLHLGMLPFFSVEQGIIPQIITTDCLGLVMHHRVKGCKVRTCWCFCNCCFGDEQTTNADQKSQRVTLAVWMNFSYGQLVGFYKHKVYNRSLSLITV